MRRSGAPEQPQPAEGRRPQPHRVVPEEGEPPLGKTEDPQPRAVEGGELQPGEEVQVLAWIPESRRRQDGRTRSWDSEVPERP